MTGVELAWLIGFPGTTFAVSMIADRLIFGNWIDLRWWK